LYLAPSANFKTCHVPSHKTLSSIYNKAQEKAFVTLETKYLNTTKNILLKNKKINWTSSKIKIYGLQIKRE
jgi:hypothetical protein